MEASGNTLLMLHRKLFSSSKSSWISCSDQAYAGLFSLIDAALPDWWQHAVRNISMLKLLLLNLTYPHINELHFGSTKRKKKKRCSIFNSMTLLIGWKLSSVIYLQVSSTEENLEEPRDCVSGLSYLWRRYQYFKQLGSFPRNTWW